MSGVLFAALLFVATGWTAVRRLDREASLSVALAQSFLLGAVAQCAVLFALSEAGIRWSRSLLLVAPLLVALAGRLLQNKAPASIPARAGLGTIELTVIAFIALLHALFATIAPVSEWDYLGIWGMKGNVFLQHGGIAWAFLEDPDNTFSNVDYPPLLPIVYAVGALIRGGWEDKFIALFTTFFGIAAAVIACDGAAVRRASLLVRIPAAIALTLVAFSDRIGLAEAPLIAFTIAGLLRVRDAVTSGSRAAMLLGAFFLGGAALTKNEGVALIIAAIAGLVVCGAYRRLIHLWPAVVLGATWQIARAMHELPTLRARGNVLERMRLNLEQLDSWSLQLWVALEKPWFWIAIVVVLAASGARALWSERFLLAVLLAQFCAIGAAYLVSHVDLALELVHSWERITHQLALLAAVTAVLAWRYRVVESSSNDLTT